MQGVKYVYKDGEYGSKLPASSIGGKKSTRFGSIGSANANKVSLGNGWVAFRSPSHGGVRISGSVPKLETNTLTRINQSKDKETDFVTNDTISYTSSPLSIKRETEFYQGYIRFKISVSNASPYVINDITLDFIYDDSLLYIAEHSDIQVKNGKFMLGNIYGNKSKTFTLLFEPLTCAKAANIKCHIVYANHEGNMSSLFMEPKEISVVCPIMKTEQDINIGRLKEFIETLPNHDRRVYEIQSGFDVKKLTNLAYEILQKHDVRHVGTLHTRDEKTCEIWYYGKTKVTKDDIIIKASILADDQTMELFAATYNSEVLTGLLAEVGRELKQIVESKAHGKALNIHIKDSVVQRSNLVDLCDMDGNCDVNVVIDGSVVQRTNVANISAENKLGKERERNLEEQDRQRREEDKIQNEKSLKKQKEDAERKKYSNSIVNTIGMEFIFVPSGDFMMGSNGDDSAKPVHKVTISKPFYIGKYPVTQKEWVSIMGSNPSSFKGKDRPVEQVSWDDVQQFIQKLNENEGTIRYRLPSEAEWEYACRAGTTTNYSFGDEITKLSEYAWYNGYATYDEEPTVVKGSTHPVGQKKPNPWGLYDMHGNVCEWMQDDWHENYLGAPKDGSAWIDIKNRNEIIIRGGSWYMDAHLCESGTRNLYFKDEWIEVVGFRLVMEIDSEEKKHEIDKLAVKDSPAKEVNSGSNSQDTTNNGLSSLKGMDPSEVDMKNDQLASSFEAVNSMKGFDQIMSLLKYGFILGIFFSLTIFSDSFGQSLIVSLSILLGMLLIVSTFAIYLIVYIVQEKEVHGMSNYNLLECYKNAKKNRISYRMLRKELERRKLEF